MIRFVHLGSQISGGLDEDKHHDFTFYNTVCDLFINLGGYQVFHSLVDFRQLLEASSLCAEDKTRLLQLVPGICPACNEHHENRHPPCWWCGD